MGNGYLLQFHHFRESVKQRPPSCGRCKIGNNNNNVLVVREMATVMDFRLASLQWPYQMNLNG